MRDRLAKAALVLGALLLIALLGSFLLEGEEASPGASPVSVAGEAAGPSARALVGAPSARVSDVRGGEADLAPAQSASSDT